MKYLLLLVLGLVIGAAAAIYFLGVPSAKAIPGVAVQAPPAGGDPPGTVIVSLSDSFLNEMLGTIFRDLGPPSFRLAEMIDPKQSTTNVHVALQGGCANTLTLATE